MITKEQIISEQLNKYNTVIGMGELGSSWEKMTRNWFKIVEGYGFTEEQATALYLISNKMI